MWIVKTSFLRAIQMSIKIKPLLSVYVEKRDMIQIFLKNYDHKLFIETPNNKWYAMRLKWYVNSTPRHLDLKGQCKKYSNIALPSSFIYINIYTKIMINN